MSFALGVGVTLGQSQKLTPQMQQAIKLLQMSSLELEQEVQAKLDNNPMLERVEDEASNDASDDELCFDDWVGDTWQKAPKSDDASDEYDDASEGEGVDLGVFDDDALEMWRENYGDVGEYAETDGETQMATPHCIQDHVRWQMNFKRLSLMDKLIAEQLIDAMDDDGFIRVQLEEIAKNFATVLGFYEIEEEVGVLEVQAVLKMIQACHPVGVGAQDLRECLRLQLDKLPQSEDVDRARRLLLHAEHLQNNDIKQLLRLADLDADDVKKALEILRGLNPNPAHIFAQEKGIEGKYEIPDILIFAKEARQTYSPLSAAVGPWRVLLNPETLPKLRINQEYASLIKRGDDSADNAYLKNNLADAKLFLRSVEERNQNLLRVATCIAQKQQGFLRHGDQAMQPLTLREVAQELDLHESTVSRLTTNKTVLTPQGIHPLKYFFSSSVSGVEGDVSSTAISAMIKQMIDDEDPKKPLSDSELTRRLEQKGMTIARRTVAKYREAMGIGSSTERRQKI